MPNKHEQILHFIQLVRESAPELQTRIFTRGACYQFHLILKERFCDAVPFYDINHVITQIDGRFYDINGEFTGAARHTRLDRIPNGWGRRFHLTT